MRNIVLLMGCFAFATITFAQENKVQKGNGLKSVSSPVVKVSNQKVSDYYQMEKKILKWTIGTEIPMTTPKHVYGQTKEEYTRTLLYWAKDNLALIELEFRSKFTDEEQFKELLEKLN